MDVGVPFVQAWLNFTREIVTLLVFTYLNYKNKSVLLVELLQNFMSLKPSKKIGRGGVETPRHLRGLGY